MHSDWLLLGDEIDVVIWSLIELLFIIVCGSLPALRPYFRSLMPRLTATWRRSTQSLKRPRSLSTTRQSAETGDIPRDSKDDMICDHLQLHPLSSVRGGEEWTKIPDEPCIPTRAVPRPSSQAFVDRAVAYLPNNIKVTRSYTVKEFHDDRFWEWQSFISGHDIAIYVADTLCTNELTN